MLFSAPDNPTPEHFPFPLGNWTPHNTQFLGPSRVYPPIGISIGSTVFARLTNMFNRQRNTQTDHATPSVAIGRIYLSLRCGLNNNIDLRDGSRIWKEGSGGLEMEVFQLELGSRESPGRGSDRRSPSEAGDRLQIVLQWCTLKDSKTIFCQRRLRYSAVFWWEEQAVGPSTSNLLDLPLGAY